VVKPGLAAVVLAFVIACGGSTSRDSSACSDCFSGTLAWGSTGGRAPFHYISSLRSCRDYGRSRTVGNEGLAQLCTTTLDPCGSSTVDIGDVQAALADPDVIAALAGSTKTYGSDSRPCDGSVSDITVNGKTIEVGGECTGVSGRCASAPCVAVPAGLRGQVNVRSRPERVAQTFVPPTVIELILMVGQPTPTGTL
jgi:hypothetical protein